MMPRQTPWRGVIFAEKARSWAGGEAATWVSVAETFLGTGPA